MSYPFETVHITSWYGETIHTKAVRGMQKTNNRRPFRDVVNSDGTIARVKGQCPLWMVCRPTLDELWFSPHKRRFDLRMSRIARQ